jgi:outer membrane protein OmpU
MNKLTKIGATALAGALVSFSAHAAEWNVTGSASFTLNGYAEGERASTWSQGDSVKITASGTTENGINVSSMVEIDDAGGQAGAFDDKYVSFGTDALGTVTFWGSGGSGAMGQFDDITPAAYEEVWDIGIQGGGTGNNVDAADSRINGADSTSLFVYASPVVAGAQLIAGMNTTADAANDMYNDIGIKFSPEMVEGLTLYYAQGTTTAATVDTDESTIGVKYAYGPITVGYQESEADQANSADDDEIEQYSIAYTVSDNLTVSYGEREYDHNTGTASGDGSETQKDSGFGVSYTMGGLSLGASMNEHENNAGRTETSADFDSYEVTVSFAF